jgi:hypothetical protein
MTTSLTAAEVKQLAHECFVAKRGALSLSPRKRVAKWHLSQASGDTLRLELHQCPQNARWLLGSVIEISVRSEDGQTVLDMDLVEYGRPLRIGPLPGIYGIEMQNLRRQLKRRDPSMTLQKL